MHAPDQKAPCGPHSAEDWLIHIADMLGAEASGLLTLHPDGQHSLVTHGHTDAAIAEYRDHFNRLDPLGALLAARPGGRALVIDTTSHPAYVAQRELSNDYLRPHGIDHVIAAQWQEPDGTRRLVGVQRFRGAAPFRARQGAELDGFIHHWRVSKALPPPRGFDARAEEARRNCDIAAQLSLPLVVVDSHLMILWANPAARDERGIVWAALFDGCSKHAAEYAIRRHLLEVVLFCLRGRTEVEVLVPTAEGRWFATATPLSGNAQLVLLRLTALNQFGRSLRGRLERLYGLTRAEAQMTVLLGQGESLEAIALARAVAIDTVRSQLRNVFKKTDTHRQGELVCLVGKLAG